jgi:hypothetical protein
MAIDWQKPPGRGSGPPFTGDQVLLAVPNLIGTAFGGNGVKVDPDFPFTVYIARWDRNEMRWATTEVDDETGGILWIDPVVPIFWAELNMPY